MQRAVGEVAEAQNFVAEHVQQQAHAVLAVEEEAVVVELVGPDNFAGIMFLVALGRQVVYHVVIFLNRGIHKVNSKQKAKAGDETGQKKTGQAGKAIVKHASYFFLRRTKAFFRRIWPGCRSIGS